MLVPSSCVRQKGLLAFHDLKIWLFHNVSFIRRFWYSVIETPWLLSYLSVLDLVLSSKLLAVLNSRHEMSRNSALIKTRTGLTSLIKLNNSQRGSLEILHSTLCSLHMPRREGKVQVPDWSLQTRRGNCSVLLKAFLETKSCTWLTIFCYMDWVLGLYMLLQVIVIILYSKMS